MLVSNHVDVNKQFTPNAASYLQGIKAKVTKVIDGDTIIINVNAKKEKVRLILVDTPETEHPQMGVQPFGLEAAAFATEQLEGKEITLEIGVQTRDKYRRLLAYVWIGDKLFNQILVEKGLARVAVYPPNTKYLDAFTTLQETAKKKGIGIWSV